MTTSSKTNKENKLRKEFENQFEGIDAWEYMNPSTDPKGISGKAFNGKETVWNFIEKL
jgi:hypothetical protein